MSVLKLIFVSQAVLFLWCSAAEAQGRGAATDTNKIMSDCLSQGSNNQNSNVSKDLRDDCRSTDSSMSAEACLAENRDSSGDLRKRCLESVKAHCAMVNFDSNKIIGCEQFGANTSKNSVSVNQLESPDEGGGSLSHSSKTSSTHSGSPSTLRSSASAANSASVSAKQNTQPDAHSENHPDVARSEASDDVTSCQNSRYQAGKCCGNPASCMTGSTQGPTSTMSSGPQGISSYCRQMKQASVTNAQTNNQAASICFNSYSSCTSTCGSLVAKYNNLADECGGSCASSAIIQSTLSQLQFANQTCSDYSKVVTALGSQGSNSADASQGGEQCDDMAQASPASLSGPPNNGSSNTPIVSQANQDCQTNPSGPGCQAQIEQQTIRQGSAEFQQARAAKGGFSLAAADVQSSNVTVPRSNSSEPAKVQGIPNGSANGIPQGGGSGFEGIQKPKALVASAAGPSTTDIDQGLRSGGGYAYGQGSIEQTESNWQNDALTGRTPAGESGLLGVNLRKYLPAWSNYIWSGNWFGSKSKTVAKESLGIPCSAVTVGTPAGCNPHLSPLNSVQGSAEMTSAFNRKSRGWSWFWVVFSGATFLALGLFACFKTSIGLAITDELQSRFPLFFDR